MAFCMIVCRPMQFRLCIFIYHEVYLPCARLRGISYSCKCFYVARCGVNLHAVRPFCWRYWWPSCLSPLSALPTDCWSHPSTEHGRRWLFLRDNFPAAQRLENWGSMQYLKCRLILAYGVFLHMKEVKQNQIQINNKTCIILMRGGEVGTSHRPNVIEVMKLSCEKTCRVRPCLWGYTSP